MPEPIVLVCRDQKFELEKGVPFRALKYLNSNDMERVETGITKLLGEDSDAFWELEPSVQEVLDFLKQVADALGFDELEGKPYEVARFVEEHRATLEADFQRFYGLRLGDLLPWELARVGVLVSALPQESATVGVVVPSAVWSLEAHLLASLIEQTDALRKQMVALWGDKRKINQKDLKPLKIDRPGMPSKYERKGTPLGFLTQQGDD